MNLLIAIDDTDNDESTGTGRLARHLAGGMEKRGLVCNTSVTRHQLLVHPDIPYTSHNSCACIEAETAKSHLRKIAEFAGAFLMENFHHGANPGLCMMDRDAVPDVLRSFGRMAQQEVIEIQDARRLAEEFGILACWQGPTGQGCIGAMAGVGLRSTGNDGRFIALDGIRSVTGRITVDQLLGCSAVQQVVSVSGDCLDHHQVIDTQDWVRPSLHSGQAVLFVMQEDGLWRPAGKRERRNRSKDQTCREVL